jgi:inositol 1,4,5-triphosphate receptor type 3
VPFDEHIKQTHFIWNYCFYMIGLKEKHKEEMNGLELEIHRKVKESDLSWFPLHRTKLIQISRDQQNAVDKRIKSLTTRLQTLLEDK